MLVHDSKESIPRGEGTVSPISNTQSNQMRRKLLTLGGLISVALFAAGCISETNSRHQNIPSRRKLLSDRSKEIFYKQHYGSLKTSGDNSRKDGTVDLQENEDLSLGGSKKWKKEETIKGKKGAELGFSVTLAGDGVRSAVGCPNDGKNDQGSALAFNNYKGKVGQTIFGNNKKEKTGSSVQMSENSQNMVIGEPDAKGKNGKKNAGRVRIFNLSGDTWKRVGKSILGKNKNENCGRTVSVSNDGKTVVVGCEGKKRSRIYKWENKKWKQVGKDIKEGGTVSMTHDGKNVAVSDYKNDKVKIYEVKSNDWKKMGNTLSNKDGYGYAISVAKKAISNVVQLAVGKKSKKDVRTYEYDPLAEKWKRKGKITSIKGQAVHITPTAYLAVGDPTKNSKKGLVKVFEFEKGKWRQKGSDIKGSGKKAQTGFSVDLDDTGKLLIVGSPGKKSKDGEAQFYRYE